MTSQRYMESKPAGESGRNLQGEFTRSGPMRRHVDIMGA